MTTSDTGFDSEAQEAVLKFLDQRLHAPVALDVWSRKESPLLLTDRDPATHAAEVVALARQLSALHPAFRLTLYDLDRHAGRAVEAGIDRAPTTVFRGINGRELRFVGAWTGALFQSVLESIAFLGSGESPLSDDSTATLAALERDVTIDVLGAMYDGHSAHMLRLIAALAVASRHVRATFTELVEYPIFAASRNVAQVPVVTVGGIASLGTWGEAELVEWVRRVAAGDDREVERPAMLTSPYYTQADVDRLMAEDAASSTPPELPPTPGGLYIPGR